MEEDSNEELVDNISKSIFKEWLEKLQQESWQLELIISGFALFGIYSSKGALVDLMLYQENIANDVFVEPLILLFQIGWKIFFLNLLIHVILRSLWIGAIGLRYVSADIDYEALNYSNLFTKYLRRKVGDYDDFIERLERICSVLFSYTFLLFLLFLSAIAFIIGIALPFILLNWFGIPEEEVMVYGIWWILPYMFLGIIVFLDFITLGGIKRIKDNTVSKIFLPIYRFYSFITLSFLYRPLLYNFIDDKYTRKLFYFSLPYIFVIAFGDKLFTENTYPYIPSIEQSIGQGTYLSYKYYDDLYLQRNEFLTLEERKDYKKTAFVRLSKYRMDDNYASFFVKHRGGDQDILKHKFGLTPIFDPGWHFSLFNSEQLEEDLKLKEIESTFDLRYQTVDQVYKGVRDSLRRKRYVGEELIRQKNEQKDRLTQKKIKILKEQSEAIANHKKEKSKSIMNALQSLIDVKVDGISYNDSLNCFFTRHPNNDEEGLICNFNIEHLKKGNHLLELERDIKYNVEDEKTSKDRYKLPFIKEF